MDASSKPGYKAEINVTPLVDVVLVLLIIFMVVTPMLQKGLAVELPEATHVGEKKSKREQAMLTVTVSGQVFLEQQQLTMDELTREVRRRLAFNPGLELFIKGDRRLDYDTVREVMGACQKAGARRVVLATRERKPRRGEG